MLWVGILFGFITILWVGWNLTLDALWQPTDRVTARRMLFLASVRKGEHVVDLGCGDGRIVVTAAREFGARATGFEIDPFRVLWGKLWIRLAGLSHRARVFWGNMYKVEIRDADVVILFLSGKANFRLQEPLKGQLKSGARIVSYYHPMWGWTPDEIGEAKGGHPLYLYRIGEKRAENAG
jgi:SAM-dependent methyltransferase